MTVFRNVRNGCESKYSTKESVKGDLRLYGYRQRKSPLRARFTLQVTAGNCRAILIENLLIRSALPFLLTFLLNGKALREISVSR